MKRFRIYAIAALLSLAYSGTSAYDFIVDNVYYNISSDTDLTVEVTYEKSGYNSYSGDVDVPAQVSYDGTDYTVTAVGDNAFRACTALTSVTIGEGVTAIGDYAFAECTVLTTVSLPGTLESLGKRAFTKCEALTSVVLPDAITSMGTYVFYKATALTELTMPAGMTEVPQCMALDCTALENITLHDNITTLGTGCFRNCSSIASVTIPANVTVINTFAFNGCSALTEVNVLATNPPVVGSTNAFTTYSSATLYVPEGCVETYKAHSIWSAFNIIEEKDFSETTGIDNVSTNGGKTFNIVAGGILMNADGLAVRIYDVTGKTVYSGISTLGEIITVPDGGIYIIRTGSQTAKVVF